jgi:hypothetical protein
MQRCFPRFLLAICLFLALVPAQAAFVNNDTSGITTIVNFDQFTGLGPYGSVITDTGVTVFTSGAFTINMNVPNYSAAAGGDIKYGTDVLIPSLSPTDPYLVSNSTTNDNFGPGQQILEFSLAGGAVSTIGIRLTPLAGLDITNIRLEAFNSSGESLDFFLITSASSPSFASIQAPGNDPSLGGFYGISSASSDIVRFRIIGGLLAMDDLGFGGLQLSGGGGPDPDPEPDPGDAAVPEASTFLLCGTMLGLLSLGGQLRKRFGRLVH